MVGEQKLVVLMTSGFITNFVRLRDVDYILDTLVDSQKQMLILGIYVRHVTHHGNMKQKVMRMRLRL